MESRRKLVTTLRCDCNCFITRTLILKQHTNLLFGIKPNLQNAVIRFTFIKMNNIEHQLELELKLKNIPHLLRIESAGNAFHQRK